MRFEWDADKAAANLDKHGSSFEEASELLRGDDDWLEVFDDSGHEDDRFIAIGLIARGVVVVVYTEQIEDVIRIISARMATPREIELFREREDRGHG